MDFFKSDWGNALAPYFESDSWQSLHSFILNEYKTAAVFPPKSEIFAALLLTSLKDTRVVVLGQDPYHGEGQAQGLAFSVAEGVQTPPSLKNIFKEICSHSGEPMPQSGDLHRWASQGVLLLNTVLTVRSACAGSHSGKGWELFTDLVIQEINAKNSPVVFLLWGANAQSKAQLITNPAHLVLKAPHPSPLSAHRGFFGCNHFNLANDFLMKTGQAPIKW